MASVKLPTNANEWVAYLGTKKLPTAFGIAKQVLNSLIKQDIPYKHLAKQIDGDPILAYYVMLNANKDRDPKSEPSASLEHGISMIGVDKLADLARHLPFQKMKADDKRAVRYLKSISGSVLAAYIAKYCAQKKWPHSANNIYWSTLMFGAPLWYLWRYAPVQMEKIRNEIVVQFRARDEVEKQVLGCSIQDIAVEFSKHHDLPDICRAAINPANTLDHRQIVTLARNCPDQGIPPMIDDKHLSITMQQPHFLVQLSQLLMNYSSFDWYSTKTLRIQKALATFMRMSLDDTIALCHQAAVEMSRTHPFPGIMLPAGKLLLPGRKRVKGQHDTKVFHIPAESSNLETQAAPKPKAQPKPEPKPEMQQEAALTAANQKPKAPTVEDVRTKPEVAKPAPTKASEKAAAPEAEDLSKITGDLNMFDDMTGMMKDQADQFYDLHELMNAAVQGLAYGLGLKRNMVSLVNRDTTRLKMYYQVGCREDGGLANFQMEVQEKSIFEKLVARPASVWIKPNSTAKMTTLIPGEFKGMINSNDFFLMSVFVGKRPVAIFFADNDGDADTPLSEAHYQRFKEMCASVTHVLNNMSDRIS